MKYENYARIGPGSVTLCHCRREEDVPPRATYGPVVRNAFIVECCTKGEGSVTVNGKEFFFKAGEGFVLFPGETVLHKTNGVARSGCWCTFVAPQLVAAFGEAGLSPSRPLLQKEKVQAITACIERMILIEGEGLGEELFRQAALFELLGHILGELPMQGENTLIGKAIALMEKSFGAELSVSAVAEEVGLERTYFSSLFKKTTGLSPYAYLSDLRIRRACELLRKGEKSIFEIAEAVGLDYRNFSRVFKAKVGQCPKDYRTEERQKRGYFTK
jgi:AraC-like DNA-binding protein